MAHDVTDGAHDGRHPGTIEEWVFAAWTVDGAVGLLSGHRIVGATAWYWAALARAGRPLLHVTDFAIPVRADPFIVKGEAMWAEHFRDAPMEQWSIGNETYAAALDDPDEALGRAYGTPTPIAFDLEWYATGPPTPFDRGGLDADDGYEQVGVVHGRVEIQGEPPLDLTEVPGHRWHRWSCDFESSDQDDVEPAATERLGVRARAVGPLRLPLAAAHTGIRAPFSFPDGSVIDLVLTPTGWAERAVLVNR